MATRESAIARKVVIETGPRGGKRERVLCTVPPQGVAIVRLQHSVHETSWQEPPNLVHQACGSRSTSPRKVGTV